MRYIKVSTWTSLVILSLLSVFTDAFLPQKFNLSNKQKCSSSFSAKPKKKTLSSDDPELIATLKRKVKARRRALGHIVPNYVKVKGSGGSANPRIRPQGKEREAGLNNPSLLRILGGAAKGRRLDSPQVYLRPMMGKVREAVYSTFTSFGLYEGTATRHLDIFSGSGSVGLESLSRGACHCTFVDFSDDCCAATARNIEWCGFGKDSDKTTKVVCADAMQALNDPGSVGIDPIIKFQIITLCPPYEEVIYADLLEAVANSPIVGDDCIILVEYPVELSTLPHVLDCKDGGKLIGVRNRRYGRTIIAMYIANPTGAMDGKANSRSEEFIPI
mmetsp:Transcript_42892/g.48727  ORF Transcript_42892/g.48727 Transcript_42892/m.48727 type:complete len:330 (+) Transcript_42892:57-1046(+)|eukprot:CAMPEP_0194146138 /NCGR_PEP_ID=MMETSP0152-20130528/19904_1 /TAXON_ID=1049557 /ORGANISM="Thalassiothrix antarctica, Strain L6-D1" /LENGTH=329 /DNA_ID=CAMNT_0038846581 /DNA_START=41 /DNA_END=1030 /DNA_ORIENTATION=-